MDRVSSAGAAFSGRGRPSLPGARPVPPRVGMARLILAGAALAVTNDTGPRHIAAALGTPVVSLFGPTDHRWTILPDIVERRILSEPFLPEEHLADRHPQRCRIDRITPDDVFAAASALLADHPGSSL